VRRPASHTGLVGWKPSAGRIPRVWGLPAILGDLEVIGTLTRTVADAGLLDGIMAGPDARDRRSLLAPPRHWTRRAPRVLYVPSFQTSPVDPEVVAAADRFADLLADDGADVDRGELFFDLESVNTIWRVISRAGVAYLMSWRNGSLEQGLGPSARAMLEDGRTIGGAEYVDALERVATLRRELAEFFVHYDLVLTPTVAALPWPAASAFPDRIAGQPAGPRDHAVFTGWVNSGGLPAISLPTALSASGLPIGVQLASGFASDDSLLAFAKRASQLSPPPPLPGFGGRGSAHS
jgi:aspartyl-tRNA(Asn)/glutamyl-tRNA(Gln) amidotransferase subunit A